MSSPACFTRLMIALVAFALCGGPQLAAAQQTTTPDSNQPQQQQPAPATQDQNVGTTDQNATPDPSKGPLKPSDTELPNAPSSTQKSTQQPQSNQSDQNQPKEAPLGVGAAQQGPVSGGAASKPAGTAIAPAKQRQVRSLLIKVGAIAAGAAAVGIVYGLSRSSPGVPPGANTTTPVQTQR